MGFKNDNFYCTAQCGNTHAHGQTEKLNSRTRIGSVTIDIAWVVSLCTACVWYPRVRRGPAFAQSPYILAFMWRAHTIACLPHCSSTFCNVDVISILNCVLARLASRTQRTSTCPSLGLMRARSWRCHYDLVLALCVAAAATLCTCSCAILAIVPMSDSL